MARLSQEAVKAAGDYVKARYSHWSKSERKHRRKQVIRALKNESPEGISLYIERVNEALHRSGL